MKSTLDYDTDYVSKSKLVIKDVGNCAIEASNDDGDFFYIVIATVAGKAYIATCGPVTPDVNELKSGYTCNLTQVDYEDSRLYKTLKFWINNKTYKITKAKAISKKDALCQFRDLGDYMLGFVAFDDFMSDSSDDDDDMPEEDDDDDDKDENI